MNLKICIIEDEKSIARYIIDCCSAYFKDASIKHFSTKSDAKDWLESNEVDLVLLDLNLNGKDGFDLLRELAVGRFHTIVVSAYRERAIEAFELGVLDFVGKPFSEDRLNKAFDRFAKSIKSTHHIAQLTIKKHNGLHFIPIDSIQYLKGAGNYSEIYVKGKRPELHNKSLDKLFQLLPTHFVRIHKSYIVALDSIVRIESHPGSKYIAILNDETPLPIGRTRVEELKQKLKGIYE